jgi:hypothetical protein
MKSWLKAKRAEKVWHDFKSRARLQGSAETASAACNEGCGMRKKKMLKAKKV